MKVFWKAASAAVLLIAATSIEIGCGDTYRPIATTSPTTTGNPSGPETEVVLHQNPQGGSSVISNINVSGDSDVADKTLDNVAVVAAFDGSRTSVYTANKPVSGIGTDSVTQVILGSSTAGFSANTTTITTAANTNPVGIAFQFYGISYTLDYIVNSGLDTATCPNTGSLTAITQASAQVKATICVGVDPVQAWIYKDQSKVFVLDRTENMVYVVSAAKYRWTNRISVGSKPTRVVQSNTGLYLYVLNSGDNTISIVDALGEQVVGTMPVNQVSTAPVVDIVQDTNYNDTSKNTQIDHLWVLQSDGTVSVFNGAVPGTLSWITSISTMTNAQLNSGLYPTNLAMMRDGTRAFVGVGNSDQILSIDTTKLATGAVTSAASSVTSVTVGVHRSLSKQAYTVSALDSADPTKVDTYSYTMSETTTPVISAIAVARGGDSAYLSKAYAITTTNTVYSYFDSTGTNAVDPSTIPNYTLPSWCTKSGNTVSCPNLYNGTAVVTAAANGTTAVNTYIRTIPSPTQVNYCVPVSSLPDSVKECPLMVPTQVLGRN